MPTSNEDKVIYANIRDSLPILGEQRGITLEGVAKHIHREPGMLFSFLMGHATHSTDTRLVYDIFSFFGYELDEVLKLNPDVLIKEKPAPRVSIYSQELSKNIHQRAYLNISSVIESIEIIPEPIIQGIGHVSPNRVNFLTLRDYAHVTGQTLHNLCTLEHGLLPPSNLQEELVAKVISQTPQSYHLYAKGRRPNPYYGSCTAQEGIVSQIMAKVSAPTASVASEKSFFAKIMTKIMPTTTKALVGTAALGVAVAPAMACDYAVESISSELERNGQSLLDPNLPKEHAYNALRQLGISGTQIILDFVPYLNRTIEGGVNAVIQRPLSQNFSSSLMSTLLLPVDIFNGLAAGANEGIKPMKAHIKEGYVALQHLISNSSPEAYTASTVKSHNLETSNIGTPSNAVAYINSAANTAIPLPSAESKARAESQDTSKEFEHSSRIKCPSKKPITEEAGSLSCYVPYRRSDAHEFYPKTENHLKESERDELARQRCLQKTKIRGTSTIDVMDVIKNNAREKENLGEMISQGIKVARAFHVPVPTSVNILADVYKNMGKEYEYPEASTAAKITCSVVKFGVQKCITATSAAVATAVGGGLAGLAVGVGIDKFVSEVMDKPAKKAEKKCHEIFDSFENMKPLFLQEKFRDSTPHFSNVPSAPLSIDGQVLMNMPVPLSNAAKAAAQHVYSTANTHIDLKLFDTKERAENVHTSTPKPRRTSNMPATQKLSDEQRNELLREYKEIHEILRKDDIRDPVKIAEHHERQRDIMRLMPDIYESNDPIYTQSSTTAKRFTHATQSAEIQLPSKELTQLLKMQKTSSKEMKSILDNSEMMGIVKQLAANEEERKRLQEGINLKHEWNETFEGGKMLSGVLERMALKVDCKPMVIGAKVLSLGFIGCLGLEKLGYFSGVTSVTAASGTVAASGAAAGTIGFGAALGGVGLLATAAWMGFELILGSDYADAMQQWGDRIINVFNQNFSQLRTEMFEMYSHLAGGISQVVGMLRQVQQNQEASFKQQIAMYELIGQCFNRVQASLHNANSETRRKLERIDINIQYLIALTEHQEFKRYRAKINKVVNRIKVQDLLPVSDAKTSTMMTLMADLDTVRKEMCASDWNGMREFSQFSKSPYDASEFVTRRLNGGDFALGYLAEKFEATTGLQLSALNVNKQQLFANHLWCLASAYYLQLLSLPSLQQHVCTETIDSIETQLNNAMRFISLVGSHNELFNKLLEEHENLLHEVQFRICQYYTVSKASKGKSDDFIPSISMPISHYITGEPLNSLNEILYRLNGNYLALKTFARIGDLSAERRKIIDELTHGDSILTQDFFPHEFPLTKKPLGDAITSIQSQLNDQTCNRYDHFVKQLNLSLLDTGLNFMGANKLRSENDRWGPNRDKKTDSLVHLNITACQDLRYNNWPWNSCVQFILEGNGDVHRTSQRNHPAIPLDFHKLDLRYSYSEFSGIWASSHIHIDKTAWPYEDNFYVLYTGNGKVAMRKLNDEFETKASEESRWLSCDNTNGPKEHPVIGIKFVSHDYDRSKAMTPNHTPMHSAQTLKTQGHLIILDTDWSDAEQVKTQYYFFNLQNRRYVLPPNVERNDWISKQCVKSPNQMFSAIYSEPISRYEHSRYYQQDEGLIIHGAVGSGQEMAIHMNRHVYRENDLPTKDLLSFMYHPAKANERVGVVDSYPIPSQSISQVKMTHLTKEQIFALIVSYKVSDTDSRLACIVYPAYQLSKSRTPSTPSVPTSTHGEYRVYKLPPNIHPLPDCQAMRTLVVNMGGKDYLFICLLSKTYTVLPFLFNPRTMELIQLADGPTIHIPHEQKDLPKGHFSFEKIRQKWEGGFPWNNLAVNEIDEDGMVVIRFTWTRIEDWDVPNATHHYWQNHLCEFRYKLAPRLKASFTILQPDYSLPYDYHKPYTALWQPLVPAITNREATPANKKSDVNINALIEIEAPNNKLGNMLLALKPLIEFQRQRLREPKAITAADAVSANPETIGDPIKDAASDSGLIQALEAIRKESNENYEFVSQFIKDFPVEPKENYARMIASDKELQRNVLQLNGLELNETHVTSFLEILKRVEKGFSFINRSLKAYLKKGYTLGDEINGMLSTIRELITQFEGATVKPERAPTFLPSAGVKAKPPAINPSNAFTERSKSSYLYTASDVDYVLQQYKKMDIFKDIEIVDVISNVGDSTPAKRLAQVSESNKTIFGIFNIGNWHWTTFYILRTKENRPIMRYKDSKYGNEAPAALAVSAASIFEGIQIQYYPGIEQTDSTSCGIFALENLRRMAIALQDPKQDKGFCTQANAHELRQKEFAEKVVLGAYDTVVDCETYKLLKNAVQKHHQVEAEQIVKILQEGETGKENKETIMVLDEKYRDGLPVNGKIGISIFVPRKLPDDLNNYRYQYELCFNTLEPAEINARLLKVFGLKEASHGLRQTKLGFYVLTLDPEELKSVNKWPHLTALPMPNDSDLEKATYASLEVSNKEEQDRVQDILKDYLKPVAKCKV